MKHATHPTQIFVDFPMRGGVDFPCTLQYVLLYSSTSARLQFRLPDGSSVTNTFPADSVLENIRQYIMTVSYFDLCNNPFLPITTASQFSILPSGHFEIVDFRRICFFSQLCPEMTKYFLVMTSLLVQNITNQGGYSLLQSRYLCRHATLLQTRKYIVSFAAVIWFVTQRFIKPGKIIIVSYAAVIWVVTHEPSLSGHPCSHFVSPPNPRLDPRSSHCIFPTMLEGGCNRTPKMAGNRA